LGQFLLIIESGDLDEEALVIKGEHREDSEHLLNSEFLLTDIMP
jgi:hypothetical protein